jgi:hypothetical protein
VLINTTPEDAKAAAERLHRQGWLYKIQAGDGQPGIKKDLIAEAGAACYEYTYKHAKEEKDVEGHISDFLLDMIETNPTRALMLSETFKLPEQMLMTIASARWCEQGYPILRLGHKRAAALMATDVSENQLEFIKPPFHAFLIELPDGLLHLKDEEGADHAATMILLQARFLQDGFTSHTNRPYPEDTYWSYIIFTRISLMQWKLNRRTSEIAGITDRGNLWAGYGMPMGHYDERVDQLVGRLICSTCIMMSNPDNLKMKVEASKRSKNGKKKDKKAPQFKVFTERQPINVDVRHYVTAYLRGERDSPHVRLMVRGHHKMQHHGPQRALRKLIWIEPYPRGGDANDPIMNSIYQAKDRKDADDAPSRRDRECVPDEGGHGVPPAHDAGTPREAPVAGG